MFYMEIEVTQNATEIIPLPKIEITLTTIIIIPLTTIDVTLTKKDIELIIQEISSSNI